MAVRAILLDIEGTTSSIAFVHEVLFPYARKHLREFVADHSNEAAVKACIRETRETIAAEDGRDPAVIPDGEVVDTLLGWIDADRKHPALKALQGMIWQDGYERGAYRAHVYPDVPPALKRWHQRGHTLAVYSSGSVQAQVLLFRHTEAGDLTGCLSDYFDTRTGPKREADSYEAIAGALKLPPAEVLFLSDVPAELDAAAAAGMQRVQVVRPGTRAGDDHPSATNFDEVQARYLGGGSA